MPIRFPPVLTVRQQPTDHRGPSLGHYRVPVPRGRPNPPVISRLLPVPTRTAGVHPEMLLESQLASAIKARATLLNRATLLDPRFRFLSDRVAQVARWALCEGGCRSPTDGQVELAHVFVSNLVRAALNGDMLSVQLRRGAYRYSGRYQPSCWRYKTVKTVFDLLERARLIGVIRGSSWSKLCTRVWPINGLKDFVRECADFELDVEFVPMPEVLIFRDQDRHLLEYPETRERTRLRRRVEELNALVAGSSQAFSAGHGMTPQQVKIFQAQRQWCRIFKRNWQSGGRFYRGGIQNVPRSARPHLLIDGQPTVEFDYSGLHATMLYHLEGHAVDADPYDFVAYPELRDFAKRVLNVLLNAKSRASATSALYNIAAGGDDLTDPDEEREDPVTEFLELHGLTVSEVIRACCDRHQPIARHFGTGVGLYLQWRDSQLMARIVNHFVRQGVVCLPIHDSARVPLKYGDELEALMLDVYEREFKFPIGVKRK